MFVFYKLYHWIIWIFIRWILFLILYFRIYKCDRIWVIVAKLAWVLGLNRYWILWLCLQVKEATFVSQLKFLFNRWRFNWMRIVKLIFNNLNWSSNIWNCLKTFAFSFFKLGLNYLSNSVQKFLRRLDWLNPASIISHYIFVAKQRHSLNFTIHFVHFYIFVKGEMDSYFFNCIKILI